MKKQQFMNQLESYLQRLSLEERREIRQDYEEHFEVGLAQGKNEEQIAASLGSPQQIAKELLAMYHLEKAEASATTGNLFRVVWAAVGLGFFNLLIVLGPILTLATFVLTAWIVAICFIALPLLVVVNTVLYPGTFEWFKLFLSIGLSGIGLLLLVGMYFATSALARGFVRYLKFNVLLVKGGLKHD